MNNKEMCVWERENDDYNLWETSCGNAFQLFAGTPSENNFKYCPYCGKQLHSVLKLIFKVLA